jgi:hypothetical protein
VRPDPVDSGKLACEYIRVVTDVKLLNYRNFVVPETSGKAEELVDQGR